MSRRNQTKPPQPPKPEAPAKGDEQKAAESAPAGAAGIPGAENRMATVDETRQQAVGSGQQPGADASAPPSSTPDSAPSVVSAPAPVIGSLAYRGARKFVTKCAIVEDGLHYEKGRVIRLTAQRANQFGAEKLDPFKDEDYTPPKAGKAGAPDDGA